MERTAVNPWQWSVAMGFNQGEVVTGHTRTLFCSGQTSVDADGAPQHAGDMAAQISLALDNLESVLEQAGMGLGNVVRLNIYTTDVDSLFEHYGVLAARMGAAEVTPPGTLLGVARLAYPDLMVELEATAVA
jgi:enamine deaminase RidA (YjgF/YER057c/UK114 family)